MRIPFSRKQILICRRPEALVQKDDDAPVFCRSNDSSGRLQHLIHSRIEIGIGKSIHSFPVKIFFQHLPLQTDLRQTGSHDHCSDQLFSSQVDSF